MLRGGNKLVDKVVDSKHALGSPLSPWTLTKRIVVTAGGLSTIIRTLGMHGNMFALVVKISRLGAGEVTRAICKQWARVG